MLLEKYKMFCERELNDTVKLILEKPIWTTSKDLVDRSCQRMLGVAFFLQEMGIEFVDVDKVYTEYKDKLYKALREE